MKEGLQRNNCNAEELTLTLTQKNILNAENV
jgi:hypothetical protein